jgi:hypothetical protein
MTRKIDMGMLFKLYGDIHKDMRKHREKETDDEIGDAIIMASYRQIPLGKLLRIQFLIGKIIKEKKEHQKIQEGTNNGEQPEQNK